MLVYEKDNKLNINFDNEISENPDLQIGKSGDKTEVLIDGQPGGSGGGSNAPLICTDTEGTLDKTMGEIQTAFLTGQSVIVNRDGQNLVVTSLITVAESRDDFRGHLMVVYHDGANLNSSTYFAIGQTEEEALAAYPTVQ